MINLVQRNKIKKALQAKLVELKSQGGFSPQISFKADQTIVTEVDQLISELIKAETNPKDCFYSEEDFDHLTFPAVILDPIDGTIEFATGKPECALSYAYMKTPSLKDGEAWIYNPFTGFEITTEDEFTLPAAYQKEKPLGLVSKSEWQKGFYKNINHKVVNLSPRGSIAFKLGLLAAGACDFIVSKKNKNIWDIAAGSILLNRRGYSFYERGTKVDSLDKLEYLAPLLWCRDEDFILLSKALDF
jgi:myo-inositol-1(or 4)-monophosphatase